MDDKNDLIIDYIVDMLDYLDGRGLIITDQDLVEKTLRTDFNTFKSLKQMIKNITETDLQ